MTTLPLDRPTGRQLARWAAALAAVTLAHAAVGVWWVARVVLAPVEQVPAVLIDMVPLPAEPAPEAPTPEPEPPEPPPPDPPAPEPSPPPEPPPAEVPLPEPPPPPPPPPPRPAPVKPAPPRPAPPRPVSRTEVQVPQATPAPVAAAPAPRGVVVPASWQSLLFAHLARHKRYPPEAQQRRQEGTALVRLVMDRGGHAIAVRLEGSSGYALLDSEAQALVRRAEPLPALPDDVPGATIEIVVPMSFRIR